MKSFKKIKVFSIVFAFIAFAVASSFCVWSVFQTDFRFNAKVVFCCYEVAIVGMLTCLITPAAITALSKGIALKESGLSIGQRIFLIDYAHNRVLDYIVKSVYIDGKEIAVTVRSSERSDCVTYVRLRDVFLTEAAASEKNNEFIDSQLDAVEDYLDVKLNKKGREYFKKEFRKLFPNTVVCTYPHEWDIESYIDSAVAKMSRKEIFKNCAFDNSYAKV